MIKQPFLVLLLSLFIFSSCQNKQQQQGFTQEETSTDIDTDMRDPFAYQLSNPQKSGYLDSSLEEISGICLLPNGQLAAIQDEEGKVFYLNAETFEIEQAVDFGKDGDYEDIAYFDNNLYILRSDGKLYQMPWQGGEALSYKTDLEEENDVEGLCAVPSKSELWLACKGRGGLKGKKSKGDKRVYAWNAQKQELRNKAVIKIDVDLLSELAGTKVKFEPSAIDIHPFSGDIYMISSVGKILIVLEWESYRVKHMQSLDYPHFMQPEGLCFSPQGSMYIATEGKGGSGAIMRFDYQP